MEESGAERKKLRVPPLKCEWCPSTSGPELIVSILPLRILVYTLLCIGLYTR